MMKLRYAVPFFLLFNIGSCIQKEQDPPQENLGVSAPKATEASVIPASVPARPVIETDFSPEGDCEGKLIARIEAAKRIRVLAYSFTSDPIITALIKAHNRSGDVQVVLDTSQENGKGADRLMEAKVPLRFDRKHAIAHQKVMIFNADEIEEGSYNYTKRAEDSNSENCNFIRDAESVRIYDGNWKIHWDHAVAPGTPKPAKKKKHSN